MRGDIGSTCFKTRPPITFFAHRNGTDQSSVSSTATVAFTHTDENVGGWFSTANGDFAPPAGAYQHSACLRTATGITSLGISAVIQKDGVDALAGTSPLSGPATT